MATENKFVLSDNIAYLKTLADNSVDSCVTDPPYGIGFMGKEWDTFKPDYIADKLAKDTRGNRIAAERASTAAGTYDLSLSANRQYQDWFYQLSVEVFRVLKPGGHFLSFCGCRTYHRMACAIEDAGFEIRDQLQWIFGSGFPKSLNISKAIDKDGGHQRERFPNPNAIAFQYDSKTSKQFSNEAISEEAITWNGWGTALKPANEPICMARKPIEKGLTVAQNVLKWGTGGINIDECRIEFKGNQDVDSASLKGRFPSNVILDEVAAEMLDQQTGILKSGNSDGFIGEHTANVFGKYANNQIKPGSLYGDSGGASRFFYCAKASQEERNKGLEGLEGLVVNDGRITPNDTPFQRGELIRKNIHPTVKPIALMEYLVKLVTPEGGLCLDPFNGSGTTSIACKISKINSIGIDMTKEYIDISEARIKAWKPKDQLQTRLAL